jgi:hypothetical protein
MKEQSDNKSTFPTPTFSHAGLMIFIVIAGFFLWTEHKAHIMGALPYLIFLLCPLMHIFMHRGHGKNGGGHGTQKH